MTKLNWERINEKKKILQRGSSEVFMLELPGARRPPAPKTRIFKLYSHVQANPKDQKAKDALKRLVTKCA